MNTQKLRSRVSHFGIWMLFLVGTVLADDNGGNRSSKPISQNNQSGQSSRWGDRLSQMQNRGSTGASGSSSSSDSRSSYRDNPSSNRTPTYDRGSSASGSRDRNGSPTSSGSIERNRGSSDNSYERTRPSTGSGSMDRNRGSSGTSSIDRNRSGNTSEDRNRNYGQSGGDRNSYDRGSWQNNGGSYRDGLNKNSGTPHTGSNSKGTYRGGHGNSYPGKTGGWKDDDGDRKDRYDKNYHDRDHRDLDRWKDSRHDWDNRYGSGRNPYLHGYYHGNYSNRRHYSHSAFSTIILGAAVGLRGYENYRSGTVYQSVGGDYVELFEHAGFRGDSLEIYAGEAVYNLKDISIDRYKSFNDRFSSIKVFGNVTVVLYTDAGLRGSYVYLNGSHIDFSRDPQLRRFNDQISSVEVIPGIVPPTDHNGARREYKSNEYLADLPPLDPRDSIADPVPDSAPSTATPVVVEPSPTRNPASQTSRVFLYDQPDFRGNQIVLDVGSVEYNLARIPKGLSDSWDHAVASIRIDGGAELFLYTDPDFLGQAIAISDSVPNLAVESRMIPFQNDISSVVVNPAR